MKLKKNGFTLMEILLIIVILGLIALMTIPRILEISEKVRKDSAATSAFGYIKSIEEACMSNYEAETEEYKITANCKLEGTYSIENGTLKNEEEEEEYTIETRGNAPKAGFLTINEGNIDGCLTFEKYSVTIENNEAKNVTNKKCKMLFEISFDYTGGEKTYEIPEIGYYKIEAWGAQGGFISTTSTTIVDGGYGGYSTGKIYFDKGDKLYINVGGQGIGGKGSVSSSYNGGGSATSSVSSEVVASGGGATHIGFKSGILSSYDSNSNGTADSNELTDLLIVAGGGGGSFSDSTNNKTAIGGNGGGMNGSTGTNAASSGTQISGGIRTGDGTNGSFGKGGTGSSWSAGGGSGYYGGGGGYGTAGGGGSGYIGNSDLTDKYMVCYNCTESSETGTKTYTTTNHSNTATSDYAKEGNGYVKITYLGETIE